MHIFNSHIHTSISKDGKATADEMCHTAYVENISGIAITDHCEISSFISENVYQKTKHSTLLAAKMKEKYTGKLFVGIGVEIGDGMLNSQYTNRILHLADYDVVLASIHVINYQNRIIHLSRVDFSKLSQDSISEYMNQYFMHLLETAQKADYDVLSHITLPLRYTNAECGLDINIKKYTSYIDHILKAVIERDKAIEVNTSEIDRIGLMPDKDILMRYRELGGTKITIGSDAHNTSHLMHGIADSINCLKMCGFTQYGYYKNRKYVSVDLF